MTAPRRGGRAASRRALRHLSLAAFSCCTSCFHCTLSENVVPGGGSCTASTLPVGTGGLPLDGTPQSPRPPRDAAICMSSCGRFTECECGARKLEESSSQHDLLKAVDTAHGLIGVLPTAGRGDTPASRGMFAGNSVVLAFILAHSHVLAFLLAHSRVLAFFLEDIDPKPQPGAASNGCAVTSTDRFGRLREVGIRSLTMHSSSYRPRCERRCSYMLLPMLAKFSWACRGNILVEKRLVRLFVSLQASHLILLSSSDAAAPAPSLSPACDSHEDAAALDR